MDDRKRIALETIDEACEMSGACKVYALFSGGDDSLAALRVAREHPKFTAAVHLNTGIGVEESRNFARRICKELRCDLIEYAAVDNITAKGKPDPQIYEQIVLEHGFPGPTKFGHGMMYVRLKERGLRRLFRDYVGRGNRAILASGCREAESERRMGTTKRISQVGWQVWVNHIHDWTKTDTLRFREQNNLERNPVAKLICKSGECMCGGFGNEGEIEELMMHDLTRPLGQRLMEIERKVLAAGFPWRWHERPPKWWLESKKGQNFLFEMNRYDAPGPMCQRCEDQAEQLCPTADPH